MKGEAIHPEENRYSWDDADATVKFAEDNNMTVTGHCLVWHSQAPRWMFKDSEGKTVTREVLIDRLYHHITNVVGRYKGRIKGWDVVNEAFEDDGSYRKTQYYNIIGPEYFELAFKFAHEADPNAELYYNDYSMSKPAKRDAVCRLVRDLKAKGCRIDAENIATLLTNGGASGVIKLLTNLCESYSVSDIALDTHSIGEAWDGAKLVTPKSTLNSKQDGTLQLEFQEWSGLPITTLHRFWVDYIEAVTRGILSPKANPNYILYRILDYACSIYAFQLLPDASTWRRLLNSRTTIPSTSSFVPRHFPR
jgi:hypothetical protein